VSPFSYEGKFYRFTDTTVTPRPYQQPHPPLRMAATDARDLSERRPDGVAHLRGLRGMAIPELAGHVKKYREAWREAGQSRRRQRVPPDPGVRRPTEKAAIDEPEDTIMYYFQRQADLTRAPLGRAGTGPVERRVTQARTLSSLSYPEIPGDEVAFGTGPAFVDRFTRLRERAQPERRRGELNPGDAADGQEKRSLQILTQQVLPAFKYAGKRRQESDHDARDNGTPSSRRCAYEPKGPILPHRPEPAGEAQRRHDQLVEEVNDALFEFDADPRCRWRS